MESCIHMEIIGIHFFCFTVITCVCFLLFSFSNTLKLIVCLFVCPSLSLSLVSQFVLLSYILFLSLSVCLSLWQLVSYLFVSLLVYVPQYVCLSVYLSVCKSVYLSACLCSSVSLFLSLSTRPPGLCLSVCMYICMSVCLYVCMYVSMSVCMSVCLSVQWWDVMSRVLSSMAWDSTWMTDTVPSRTGSVFSVVFLQHICSLLMSVGQWSG